MRHREVKKNKKTKNKKGNRKPKKSCYFYMGKRPCGIMQKVGQESRNKTSYISHASKERGHVVWTQTTIEISIFHITVHQELLASKCSLNHTFVHFWKLGFGILPQR